jgi:hypothetical protein
MSKRVEQGFVRAIAAQAATEAFHEGVLLRLVGRDTMPLHLPVLAPVEDYVTGQFDAVGTSRSRIVRTWRV